MNPVNYIKQDALLCEWDSAPYLLFSSEVEPLVYYSHLFPAIAVLILSIVVLKRSPGRLTSKLFFTIGLLFSLFAVFDLILWATEKPSLIMFLWSLLTYIEPLIYITTLYFVLVFAKQQDVSLATKLIVGFLFLPIILLGPTHLNLSGFDYTNCWRLAVEGPLLYYVYFLEIILVGWMITTTAQTIRSTKDPERKRTLLYLLIGSLLFLLAFSSGNIIGTLMQGVMGEEAWVIGQYGFFGMPIFLGFIMYLMVKYEIFAARVVYAEAIMLAMMVSLVSLLFIPDESIATPVLFITIGLFAVLGYFLIIGIRRDIEQKIEIENLAEKLKKANERLKVLDQMKSEFVSVASHQLRSPLTSIRGYASMLLEGSYGKLSEKGRGAVERIAESSRYMAMSVEDYLNVSRIEAGRMKYELCDFNLKTMVEKIVDDIRPIALKKGLVLTSKTSELEGKGVVKGDQGKSQQIIHNLVDNALKYTPKGDIIVRVYDDKPKKLVHLEVIDSGVGLDQETINELFHKFVRARNANEVNVSGTGLGLYVAKQMAEGMGGSLTVESDGPGKGSTFRFTLPFVQ